jgi:hypothetical protein
MLSTPINNIVGKVCVVTTSYDRSTKQAMKKEFYCWAKAATYKSEVIRKSSTILQTAKVSPDREIDLPHPQ